MLAVADKNTEKVSFSFKEFAFDYLFYYKYKQDHLSNDGMLGCKVRLVHIVFVLFINLCTELVTPKILIPNFFCTRLSSKQRKQMRLHFSFWFWKYWHEKKRVYFPNLTCHLLVKKCKSIQNGCRTHKRMANFFQINLFVPLSSNRTNQIPKTKDNLFEL